MMADADDSTGKKEEKGLPKLKLESHVKIKTHKKNWKKEKFSVDFTRNFEDKDDDPRQISFLEKIVDYAIENALFFIILIAMLVFFYMRNSMVIK